MFLTKFLAADGTVTLILALPSSATEIITCSQLLYLHRQKVLIFKHMDIYEAVQK